MKKHDMPSKDLILDRFNYDPASGKIYYKKWTNGLSRNVVGKEAGTPTDKGYLRVKIKGVSYAVHRLVYYLEEGNCPDEIDHVNGDTLDNRIENLRPANRSQNCANTKSSCNSSSKYKGVSWHRSRSKWQASIRFKGKQEYIGVYDDEKEAAKAYDDRAREVYKEYAKLNNS